MQTFLPYEGFGTSAAILDNKRLGKQRVETMQIMAALLEGRGWVNHPATLMWRGSEMWLMRYQVAVCQQWTSRRGVNGKPFTDTCLDKTKAIVAANMKDVGDLRPKWLGNRRFHRSHQSNLLRKNPEHYGQHFSVPDDIEYVWPTKEGLMWT